MEITRNKENLLKICRGGHAVGESTIRVRDKSNF